MRVFSSGCFFFLALFCIYGFIASGEYDGEKEIVWKTTYVVLGLIAVVGAFWRALNKKMT